MPQAPMEAPASRWDIFLGYSYLAPHGSVHNSPIPEGSLRYQSVNYGAMASGSYFLNRFFGFTAEYGNHSQGINDGIQTIEGGVIFRFPWDDITPFIHGLAGTARVGGPNAPGTPECTENPCQPGTDLLVEPYHWGVGLTTGGGVDYLLPWFNHHLALRVFQADYEFIHANFGPGNTQADPPGNVLGGRVNIDAARLSTGLVFKFGEIAPPPPVTYTCSVSPSEVYPGDPITVTGTAGMLNPKKTAMYSWSANGGQISGKGPTATIATTGTAPGSYTATGHVTEGPKAGQSADCTASFTVKDYEPPTITCSANPSTVAPGRASTYHRHGIQPAEPSADLQLLGLPQVRSVAPRPRQRSARRAQRLARSPSLATCKMTRARLLPRPPTVTVSGSACSSDTKDAEALLDSVLSTIRSVRLAWTTKPRLALTK